MLAKNIRHSRNLSSRALYYCVVIVGFSFLTLTPSLSGITNTASIMLVVGKEKNCTARSNSRSKLIYFYYQYSFDFLLSIVAVFMWYFDLFSVIRINPPGVEYGDVDDDDDKATENANYLFRHKTFLRSSQNLKKIINKSTTSSCCCFCWWCCCHKRLTLPLLLLMRVPMMLFSGHDVVAGSQDTSSYY